MASTYEYIISLQDKASGTMQRIVGASSVTVNKLTALADKAKKLQGVTGNLSGSMFHLKQRIDLLQQEKELLDPSNLNLIKQYNQEIDRLSGRIEKLDNAGRGGKLKGYLGEIGSMVKGFCQSRHDGCRRHRLCREVGDEFPGRDGKGEHHGATG